MEIIPKVLLIVGQKGSGKRTLAEALVKYYPEEFYSVEFYTNKKNHIQYYKTIEELNYIEKNQKTIFSKIYKYPHGDVKYLLTTAMLHPKKINIIRPGYDDLPIYLQSKLIYVVNIIDLQLSPEKRLMRELKNKYYSSDFSDLLERFKTESRNLYSTNPILIQYASSRILTNIISLTEDKVPSKGDWTKGDIRKFINKILYV